MIPQTPIFSKPDEGLTEVMERFLTLGNAFKSISTPTGKRMYAITYLCELEYTHYRLTNIAETWRTTYPLHLDRNELVNYIALFDDYGENPLYSSLYSCMYSADPFSELSIEPNTDYGNRDKEMKASDATIMPEEDFNKATELYTEVSARKMLDETIRKMAESIRRKDWPIRCKETNIDNLMFENIFNKYASLYNLLDTMGVGFNEKGKEKLTEYREFLLKIDTGDLTDIIRMKYQMLKEDLKAILRIVDEPDDDTCECMYMEATELFEKLCPENRSKNEQWRRYNSKKRDYSERLRKKKNEMRAQIEGYGWDSEWQDMFEYEENDVQPDNLAIGSFIHYHLKEMQTDGRKMLLAFMGLIEDWLFYTWEEMTLLESERPGSVTVQLSPEEQVAIREDFNYLVPKESSNVTPSPQTIIINGDVNGTKTVDIDKNFGTIIDNE